MILRNIVIMISCYILNHKKNIWAIFGVLRKTAAISQKTFKCPKAHSPQPFSQKLVKDRHYAEKRYTMSIRLSKTVPCQFHFIFFQNFPTGSFFSFLTKEVESLLFIFLHALLNEFKDTTLPCSTTYQ